MADIIAIIFDFDDTLAPDSTTGFLAQWGEDPRRFWDQRVQPLLADGWDPIPAYLHVMLELSRARPAGERITRERLAAWGRKLRLHPGVTQVFDDLRAHVAALDPALQLEFYLISSGIRDIVANTRIARQFTEIWSCDFHCNEAGEIVFPKNVISFTDKTRYLFQVSKGIIGPAARHQPFAVNQKMEGPARVPFSQMIFVGDGYTDIPCFSLIKRFGGMAVGVYDTADTRRWGRAFGFVKDGRVAGLYPADYRKNSALRSFLHLTLEQIAGNVHGRRNSAKG